MEGKGEEGGYLGVLDSVVVSRRFFVNIDGVSVDQLMLILLFVAPPCLKRV